MKKQELKELLTPEFLSTLHTAVECCNWDVDMIETMKFCDWCYGMVELPQPEYDMSFEMEEETMTDLDRLLEKFNSRPPSLWNIIRHELGYSIDMCDEIVEAVERWLPKEDPRPSYDTMQWDKCVRMMREKLWDQTE